MRIFRREIFVFFQILGLRRITITDAGVLLGQIEYDIQIPR